MLIALTSILLLTYFGPMVDPKLDAVGWVYPTLTLTLTLTVTLTLTLTLALTLTLTHAPCRHG